jgi:serine/threonine protein kinase/tetratricopeptide (TPR) repeat protein
MSVDTSHDRVMEVLADALDQPTELRTQFLDQACADDPKLRQEVERLLGAEKRAKEHLRTSVGLDHLDAIMAPPKRIGPYHIVREIGDGGMGVVYLALQQEPIRRPVALKLLRPGMDSRQVISRFAAERQTLALLEHPNVARIYDAGTSEAGRPYFVMEYVDGPPVTTYCDTKRLNTRQRVALFIKVCEAVLHAHQKGVIHRDIKPSNILVGEQNGQPTPKVIDFGVAKALDDRGLDEADPDGSAATLMQTEHGQLIGTPEYMSPEQAKLGRRSIDTRTDVYSLGVVLYQLLTGVLPFDSAELRAKAFDELCRTIRETEPPRPSTRLFKLNEPRDAWIERRRDLPERLSRQLKGDLDWIVMRAMEKDPNRRYASVAALIADLQRFLDDEPVDAGPPSAKYRLVKFFRRHRVGAAAVGAIMLLLVAGITTTSLQLTRAQAAELEAKRQRDRALDAERRSAFERNAALTSEKLAREQREFSERRYADIRQLAGKLMFDVDDALIRGGPTLARQKLLATAVQYLDGLSQETRNDPELLSELVRGYLRIGAVQYLISGPNLGDPVGAAESYAKAVTLCKQRLTLRPDDVNALDDLAQAYYYSSHAFTGQFQHERALESLKEAHAIWAKLQARAPNNWVAARGVTLAIEETGDVYQRLGRIDDAMAEYERCLKLREELSRRFPDNERLIRDLAVLRDSLTTIHLQRAEPEKALEDADGALTVYRNLIRDYPENSTYKRALSVVLERISVAKRMLNDADGAFSTAQESLSLRQQLFEADPGNSQARIDLASAHKALADAYTLQEKFAEALPHLGRCIDLRRRIVAEAPAGDRVARSNLCAALVQAAGAYRETGERVTAAKLLAEAIQNFDEMFETGTAQRSDRNNAAIAYTVAGELAGLANDQGRALDHFDRGLEIARSADQNDPRVVSLSVRLHHHRGAALLLLGRRDDARVAWSDATRLLDGAKRKPGDIAALRRDLEILKSQIENRPIRLEPARPATKPATRPLPPGGDT